MFFHNAIQTFFVRRTLAHKDPINTRSVIRPGIGAPRHLHAVDQESSVAFPAAGDEEGEYAAG